jgi:hypothetical protein
MALRELSDRHWMLEVDAEIPARRQAGFATLFGSTQDDSRLEIEDSNSRKTARSPKPFS